MGKYSLDEFDRGLLRMIIANPGLSGFRIHEKLAAEWRGTSTVRRLFGWLTGPSLGRMYASLAKLERFNLVKSEWGQATKERGWYRPRLYWTNEPFSSGERTE